VPNPVGQKNARQLLGRISNRRLAWWPQCAISLGAIGLATSPSHAADEPAKPRRLSEICATRTEGFSDDVKCYLTSPTRWDGRDWIYVASSVAVFGLAHNYDDDVRTHFVGNTGTPPPNSKSYEAEDAVPAAGVFAATLLYATITKDADGKSESWQMLEAAGFSSATSYLLKYAGGRERPNKTSDPDQWRVGGDSFPSGHTTAAFAIGTVFAESGNDRFRWTRRILGYGMAAYTGYARLKHNAHWLSDTVAGAEIGMSTANFVMNRRTAPPHGLISWAPLDGGVMVSYSVILR
jgi:hypothetical protein